MAFDFFVVEKSLTTKAPPRDGNVANPVKVIPHLVWSTCKFFALYTIWAYVGSQNLRGTAWCDAPTKCAGMFDYCRKACISADGYYAEFLSF